MNRVTSSNVSDERRGNQWRALIIALRSMVVRSVLIVAVEVDLELLDAE